MCEARSTPTKDSSYYAYVPADCTRANESSSRFLFLDDVRSATGLFTAGWRSPANGRLDFDDDEADCFNDVGCFDTRLDFDDDDDEADCFNDVGCFDANLTIDVSDASPKSITCDDGFNDDDLDFFLLCFKEYKHCEKIC